MVSSLGCLVRDVFFSLRGVFNGIVEGIFGRVNELGERVFELLDRLVFGRELFEEEFRSSVRLNGYLAHDLLVRNDEGSGEGRKWPDLDELHDCCDVEDILNAVMQ